MKEYEVTKAEWAYSLGELGYSIYPILPNTKRFTLHHWATESSCRLDWIENWWEDFPDDNIGINCGESGLLVVDVDHDEALESLKSLARKYGSKITDDEPPVIETRRGFHFYFNQPEQELPNTASKLAGGIDTRGVGGMVVGPGSVFEGFEYRLVRGDLAEVPDLPVWLEYLLRPKEPKMPRQYRTVPEWYASFSLLQWEKKIEEAPVGEQNITINKAAYSLAMDGVNPEEIEERLMDAAERGNHPLSRALATIRSGINAALKGE